MTEGIRAEAAPPAADPGIGRPEAPRVRTVAALVFGLLFVSYAWFAQGGGWNQNARFAQVRSLVETGSFSANPFVAYHLARPGDPRTFSRLQLPERAPPPPDPRLLATLDLSYLDGRFIPNKPPGVSLLAAPGYLLVTAVERLLGIDPDDWFVIGLNAHLTALLSVGLLGAFAGVWVFGISRQLAPSVPLVYHAATALTTGLATLCLPFATLLMDHVVVASLALAAFGLLLSRRPSPPGAAALCAAGAICGLMVVVNYSAALVVAVLGAYASWRVGFGSRDSKLGRIAWFVLAGLPFAAFLAWYHNEFGGGVFETANSHQPEFMNESSRPTWLGMIGVPDPTVAWRLLFSSYRGLFVSSPVLLLGLLGLLRALRSRTLRPEALVCLAIFATLWLLNASFNGWHGGHSFGPRYLVPAVPFLALPLARSFSRWPVATISLALLSAALMLVATTVSPQVPAPVENPWEDFMLPLSRGDALVLGREHLVGPVSTNPTGIYESGAHRLFAPDSEQARWASFNLGELMWPGSWVSVLPLLCMWAIGLAGVLVASRVRLQPPRPEREAATPTRAISGIPAV